MEREEGRRGEEERTFMTSSPPEGWREMDDGFARLYPPWRPLSALLGWKLEIGISPFCPLVRAS